MDKYSSSAEEIFSGRMVAAGWDPVRDTFGNMYAWENNEERRVGHTDALRYWLLTNNLPVDSLKIGEYEMPVGTDAKLSPGTYRVIISDENAKWARIDTIEKSGEPD